MFALGFFLFQKGGRQSFSNLDGKLIGGRKRVGDHSVEYGSLPVEILISATVSDKKAPENGAVFIYIMFV